MAKTFSNPDRILQSAVAVCNGRQREFSAGEIVVAAWSDHPAEFGLADSDLAHPDTPKIMDAINNKRNGLLANGLFERKDKKFVITEDGRERAKELSKDGAKKSFTGESEKFLSGLLSSVAFKSLKDSKADALTRDDCFAYLGITEKTKDIGAVLAAHDQALNAVDVKVDEAGEGGSITVDAIQVDAGVVRFLRNVSNVCRQKCANYLSRMGFSG